MIDFKQAGSSEVLGEEEILPPRILPQFVWKYQVNSPTVFRSKEHLFEHFT